MSEYLNNQTILSSLLPGAIDFCDRQDAANWYQMKRFDWWQSLVDDCNGEVDLPLPTYKPSLERVFAWFDSQVAPSLAVLYLGLGPRFDAYLESLVASGESRFKDYHWAWIEYLNKEVDCAEDSLCSSGLRDS